MHLGKEGEVVLWWPIKKWEAGTVCQGPDSQKSLLFLS